MAVISTMAFFSLEPDPFWEEMLILFLFLFFAKKIKVITKFREAQLKPKPMRTGTGVFPVAFLFLN